MINIEGLLSVFIAGAAGVVVVEAAKFANFQMGKNSLQRTRRYRRMTYWFGFLALLFVSGFVTVLSIGPGPIELITALQVGVNAPAIVTAWGTASARDTIVRTKGASLNVAPPPVLGSKHTGDFNNWIKQVIEDQAW